LVRPSPQIASSPRTLLGVKALPLPSAFYSCGAYPKVLKEKNNQV
jgi:hypothetical protein